MHADAQGLDARLECGAAFGVELHRHQAWGELDHMGFKAQGLQCVGRFQAEQATTDHHAALGVGRGIADRVEVVEGAVDQT
ncbi:hypothetical protein D3C86_2095070 [compost metagenome]